MNKTFKTYLIVILSIIVGGSAFTYGALTAPKKEQTNQQVTVSKKPSPSATPEPSKEPKKLDLNEQLTLEESTIIAVLVEKYPKISTDYVVNKGQLFDKGQWYGTTLTYKGSNIDNRDTLRVLMYKKDDIWTLKTTPPRPILSAKDFPDAPKTILQIINKPISLPAGAANSPAINPAV